MGGDFPHSTVYTYRLLLGSGGGGWDSVILLPKMLLEPDWLFDRGIGSLGRLARSRSLSLPIVLESEIPSREDRGPLGVSMESRARLFTPGLSRDVAVTKRHVEIVW